MYPSLPAKFERVVVNRETLYNCREGNLEGETETRPKKEKTRACKNAVWSPERVCFGAVRTTEEYAHKHSYIHTRREA